MRMIHPKLCFQCFRERLIFWKFLQKYGGNFVPSFSLLNTALLPINFFKGTSMYRIVASRSTS